MADDDINASVLAADLARLSRDMDDTSSSARTLDRRVGDVRDGFDLLETSLLAVQRVTDLFTKSIAALTAAFAPAAKPVTTASKAPAIAGVSPEVSTALGGLGDSLAPLRGKDTPVVALVDALTGLSTRATDAAGQVPGLTTAIGSLSDGWGLFNAAAESSTVKSIKSFEDNKKAIGSAIKSVGSITGVSTVLKALSRTTAGTAIGLGALATQEQALALKSRLLAGAQALVNAAFWSNPIVLAVAAIVALAAGFYLAYTRIGWFRNAVNAVFSWIRTHWPLLVAMLTGPMGIAVLFIVRHFGQIVTAVRSLPARIGAVARTMWSGFRSAASSAVHVVADRLRDLVSFVGRLPGSIGKLAGRIWKAFSGAADGAVHWVADRLRQLVAMIGRIPGQLVGLAKHIPGAGLLGKGLNLITGGGKDDKKPSTPKPATAAAAAPRRGLIPLGAGPSRFDATLPFGTNPKNNNAEIAKHMSALKDGLAVTRNINLHIDGQKVASVVMRDWEDRGAAL